MNTPGVKSAAIYARISKSDKRVMKTENQVELCKRIAAAEGWTVDPRHIYVDEGIAASGKEIDDTTLENRPAARRLLADAKTGAFKVIIAVEGERLARTYLDGLQFIKTSAEAGITWYLDTDGPLDPSTPAGEEAAVGIFAQGRREGRVRNARQKRRYDREIAAGLPLWGPRPLGWEEDRITVREAEAVHVREAVRSILEDGATVWAIAQRWNSVGLQTDKMREGKGAVWTTTTVRQVLTRPRNAGILIHKDVEQPNSKIQPLVSREDFDAMLAMIKGQSQLRGPKPQYLLGGIMKCPCGATMHASKSISGGGKTGRQRREYQIYRCRLYGFDKTKRHATIQLPIADAVVRDWAVEDIGLGVEEAPEHSRARLAEVAARLAVIDAEEEAATELILEGIGNTAKVKEKLRALQAERDGLKSERDQIHAESAQGLALARYRDALAALDDLAPDAEIDAVMAQGFAAWDALSMDDRRTIIRNRYTVTVDAGGRGADRVRVEPKLLPS